MVPMHTKNERRLAMNRVAAGVLAWTEEPRKLSEYIRRDARNFDEEPVAV